MAGTAAVRLALGSIAIGLAVLGLKTLAFLLTGSVALLSDALESVVNVAAAAAAFVAVRLAAKPADRNHPYGHHKAEYVSAVAEGVLIIGAAIAIALAAWDAFTTPHEPDLHPLGLAVNGAASLVNAAWAAALIRAGRRLRSPALAADGRHLLTDVASSAAVLLGIGLAAATGWTILDPILALVVAANVLVSGFLLVRASLGGLMDEAVDAATLERIGVVIREAAEGAIEAHDLRTRRAGRVAFVDFHLVVPGDVTVAAAHAICDRIETALKRELGEEAAITIHVEPEEKAKRTGAGALTM